MAIKYDETIKVHSAGAMEMEYSIAGLGSRTYAFTIDWHIRVVLVLAWLFLLYLAGLAINLVDGDLYKTVSRSNKIISYLLILPSIAIYMFYHPVLEIMMKGRTPGKRMAGIRIITVDGEAPNVSAIIVRNLFRIVDSLPTMYLVGIGCCLFTTKQVRIGDLAAHTLLVHEEVMEDKAIEQMSMASHIPGLSAAQIEVMHDLLKRWKQLELDTRIRLGSRLLEAVNQTVEKGKSSSTHASNIHSALIGLSGGNSGKH